MMVLQKIVVVLNCTLSCIARLSGVVAYKLTTKHILTISLITYHSSLIIAQDIHFSQFNATPLFINPAATGSMGQDYRASLHYKNQWQSVSQAYKTMGLGFDCKLLKKGRDKKNNLGAGFTVFSDKAGVTNFNTLQAQALVAYNLQVTRAQRLALGVNVGFIQQSINIANLKWDNQFDGNVYDASRETGENSTFSKTLALDLGAGLLWKLQPKHSPITVEAGAAVAHISGTKNSFYKNNYKTPLKYSFHLSSQIKVGSLPLSVSPQLLIALQKPYQETVLGAQFKYIIGQDSRDGFLNTYSLTSSAIGIGVYYRLKDAVIAMLSYDYKKTISVNLSYDLNVSQLKNATKNRGGMEVSLIYKGFYQKTGLAKIPVD